jgi:hypothetical protein
MPTMRNYARICIALSMLLLPANLQCQFICTTAGNCSCENEKVLPNLTIANRAKLTGVLFDPSAAPIQFNKTVIQVRNPKNNKVLFSAVLDDKGRFDFGTVPIGTFRLIALWEQGTNVRRLPLFDQPKPVLCSGENECHLEIVLTMHGTDQPFEFCPPK